MEAIKAIEKEQMRFDLPYFKPGDTVKVHVKIKEGEKERIQVFNGVVIGRRGPGINAAFKVRRIVYNEGVERTFLGHSPNVGNVKIRRRGKVRRAKLYFLRDRIGKARKLRELRTHQKQTEEPELAATTV